MFAIYPLLAAQNVFTKRFNKIFSELYKVCTVQYEVNYYIYLAIYIVKPSFTDTSVIQPPGS